MWPFSENVTAQEFLKKVVSLAHVADERINEIYEKHNPAPLFKMVDCLLDFEVSGIRVLEEQTGSKDISVIFRRILGKAASAKMALVNDDFIPAHRLMNEVLKLEKFLTSSSELVSVRPSRELSRILSYTPAEAFSKGFLFRGVPGMNGTATERNSRSLQKSLLQGSLCFFMCLTLPRLTSLSL